MKNINEILSKLNSEQIKPVLETEGKVLVIAGAGSGKTRVLTSRIAYLVAEKGVSPYEIMAITFGISAFLKKNTMGIGIGISFGLYFLNILSNLEDSLEFIGKVTPFGYASSAYIIEHGKIDVWPLVIGIVLMGLGVALAFARYTKKDIK